MPNPPFEIRGVVEGFYGEPWSHANRLRATELFPEFGFNTYLIAPKDDPTQRIRWREQLSGGQMHQTSELIERGLKNGLNVAMTVSPGLSVQYSSLEDREYVLQRFIQQSQWGCSLFALLWDDIDWDLQYEEDLRSYEFIEDAQADFSNWLFTELLLRNPKSQMMVCPMIYNGRGQNSYIARLGEKLHSNIDLMWTGREIRSPYLDSIDAETFTLNAGRRPLYWDNFPVNNLSMRFELHMGPLIGRQPELAITSRGLLSNPMNQFECSLLPLFTIGQFLSSPDKYDAEVSWQMGFDRLFGNHKLANELSRFFRTVMSSPINSDAAPEVRKGLSVALNHLRQGQRQLAAELIQSIGKQISQDAIVLLAATQKEGVFREISPWLPKYRLGGEALKSLAEFTLHPTDRNLANLIGLSAKLDADRHIVFGDVLDGVIDEIIHSHPKSNSDGSEG